VSLESFLALKPLAGKEDSHKEDLGKKKGTMKGMGTLIWRDWKGISMGEF